MSKATSESEHLKDMLVGNILAVSWAEVRDDGCCYAAPLACFTTSVRRQFLAISIDPAKAEARRAVSVRFWDFLFYASFGFVVTSSVSIAGVLLVFCYLIVPSVGGHVVRRQHRASFSDRLDDGHNRLGAGGVAVSLKLDLPTGATIVCTFGSGCSSCMAAVRAASTRGRRSRMRDLRVLN